MVSADVAAELPETESNMEESACPVLDTLICEAEGEGLSGTNEDLGTQDLVDALKVEEVGSTSEGGEFNGFVEK
ncbi:hypothetical protein U1Q18_031259 [Sarracenia purpurea var. burkii]